MNLFGVWLLVQYKHMIAVVQNLAYCELGTFSIICHFSDHMSSADLDNWFLDKGFAC